MRFDAYEISYDINPGDEYGSGPCLHGSGCGCGYPELVEAPSATDFFPPACEPDNRSVKQSTQR